MTPRPRARRRCLSTCEARGWDTPTALASATCVIGAFAAIRARAIAAVPGPHLRTGRLDDDGTMPVRV